MTPQPNGLKLSLPFLSAKSFLHLQTPSPFISFTFIMSLPNQNKQNKTQSLHNQPNIIISAIKYHIFKLIRREIPLWIQEGQILESQIWLKRCCFRSFSLTNLLKLRIPNRRDTKQHKKHESPSILAEKLLLLSFTHQKKKYKM